MLLINGLTFLQVKHPFQILDFVFFLRRLLFYTLQTRKLDRVNFRKDFWDRYGRRGRQA